MLCINNGSITCEQIKEHTNRNNDLIELNRFIIYGSPYEVSNPLLVTFVKVFNQLSGFKV